MIDRVSSSAGRATDLTGSARLLLVLLVVPLLACSADSVSQRADARNAAHAPTPLASWNDGPAKSAILDFVHRVSSAGGPDFVPPGERIAVFDNDGTLWVEQPVYTQFAFALDRVRALAPRHPEWQEKQPFKGVLEGNADPAAMGEARITELVAATHAGISTESFARTVRAWIETARHPHFDRPYTDLVYQPMLELLDLLRARGFTCFVVTGGGADFVRPWAEAVYGIPPERIVGSRASVRYELRDGTPTLLRLPAIDLVDDGAGKPVGIHQQIGRRPILAVGNSDGDFEMLEWTTAGPGLRLGLIVHHTDGIREWAYDRNTHVGRLTRALAVAPERGWVIVDMARDWKEIFTFDATQRGGSEAGSTEQRRAPSGGR